MTITRLFPVVPLGLVVLLGRPGTAGAQRVVATPQSGQTLTLDDALVIARRHNPAYQQILNAQTRASAQRRAAYGALLPSVSTDFGVGLREGRQQFFAGVPFGSPNNVLSSSGGLSARLSISPGLGYGLTAANRSYEAADHDLEQVELALRRDVTVQYMTALQAKARVALTDSLMASAETQLEQARARAKAGLQTDLDVRRSEVALGQAEVQRLQAVSQAEVEMFRLYQQLGLAQGRGVELSADLPIVMPTGALADLVTRALEVSPQLKAARARVSASQNTYRAQTTAYLPSLQLSASVSGATQKLQGTVTAAQAAQSQGTFPFDFVRQPYTLNAGLSLPLFDGFQREQAISVAAANRRDAEAQLRQAELAVQTTVVSQVTILQADAKAVEINGKNRQAAREALSLADQRYRLGLASLVDLVQARADYERASNDYITSVYTFHRDRAQLEAVTGPLR